jgi:hypothetical protein
MGIVFCLSNELNSHPVFGLSPFQMLSTALDHVQNRFSQHLPNICFRGESPNHRAKCLRFCFYPRFHTGTGKMAAYWVHNYPSERSQSAVCEVARYGLRNSGSNLSLHTSNGRLEIDNNLTENAIRPSAFWKKNWLFIGHPEAGWRSAVIYSVIVSCRRRGIEPWDYLRDVLQRLPAMKQSELPTILPRCWKPA